MTLWDCVIRSSSWGSSPTFPPVHKGCRRPQVPRGHCAVTRGEETSREWDLLSPPSPFLPCWSSCASFYLIL